MHLPVALLPQLPKPRVMESQMRRIGDKPRGGGGVISSHRSG
jgi:hypothetical protein